MTLVSCVLFNVKVPTDVPLNVFFVLFFQILLTAGMSGLIKKLHDYFTEVVLKTACKLQSWDDTTILCPRQSVMILG